MTELKAALAERTSDLQRLHAEYVNYKRRVDRDRDLARKVTIEGVLKDLLSVLDDVRSAREHDELIGGFKAVADEIERITSKYGLETFGEVGEPFNPQIHEALLHAHARASTARPAWRSCSPGTGSEIASCGPPGSRSLSPSPMLPLLSRSRWRRPQRATSPEPVEEPSSGPADEPVEAAGESGEDESAANDHQIVIF